MSRPKLLEVCLYFLQLEERAKADCMPNIAAHASKQYSRYKMRLEAQKAVK